LGIDYSQLLGIKLSNNESSRIERDKVMIEFEIIFRGAGIIETRPISL